MQKDLLKHSGKNRGRMQEMVLVQDTQDVIRRIGRDKNGGHCQYDQHDRRGFDEVPHRAMIYLPGGANVKK